MMSANPVNSDQTQQKPQRVVPVPSVLGQVAQGLGQLFLLFTASVFVFVISMIYVGQYVDHNKKNDVSGNQRRADRDRRRLSAEYFRAKKRREQTEKNVQRQAEGVEAALESLAKASPGGGGRGGNPASAAAGLDSLTARLNDPKQATNAVTLSLLSRVKPNDPRLPEFAKLLTAHAKSPSAPLDRYALLAVKWDSAEFSRACLEGYRARGDRAPESGQIERVSTLVRYLQDPSGAELMLHSIPAKRIRVGERLNSTLATQYGAWLVAVRPVDGPLLARYVLEDTEKGDIVRGALSHLSTWPEEVVAAFQQLPVDLDRGFEGRLQIWLDEAPPAVAVRDALFPAVARCIPRTSTGDETKDTRGVGLLSLLVTRNTAPRVAQAAVRLEAGNPAAARTLTRLILASHPVETFDILAAAYQDADVVDVFPKEFHRNQADQRIAFRLLSDEDGKVAVAAARCLAAWGGPATARVLRVRKRELGLRNPRSKTLGTIVKKIEERVGSQPETGG